MTLKTLPDIWPFSRDPQNPLLPPPQLAEVRETGDPVEVFMYDGARATLVTTYAQVVEVLTSPNVSSDGTKPGFPYISDSARANRGSRPTIDRLDSPEHDRQRAMLAPSFTMKKIRTMRPAIEETVGKLLDTMEAKGEAKGGVDLLTEFAELVPATVVTQLMGLPLDRADFFLDRVHRWMNDQADPADIAVAMEDIKEYFGEVVDSRIGSDGTDLISILVRERLETGQIDRNQLLLTLHLLLSAGFETTANAIALGAVALLQEPEAWRELAETDDDEVVKGAVEEVLRFVSPAHQTHIRIADGEIPVGHYTIQPGEGIIATHMAANHDPAQFPDPDRLDIHRDARSHLAFGLGLHQCLGQALARLEMQVVFSMLPRRFPNLRLEKPVTELTYKTASIAYTAAPVPVTW
ncbi:cytochrome P450 [Glaciibacter sp. 2TAF33]|uniref:cytochrome P450 n=1 Tax=Glaciibacter sp. 2TAF33 TaxID=3233015 RepID=UPI003F8F82E6